jgi:hypothetical protein
MNPRDQIKAELNNLIEEAKKLPALAGKIEEHMKFSRQCQAWYTKAIKLVSVLAPDRFVEFRDYYQIDPRRKTLDVTTYRIQDYIKGLGPSKDVYGKAPWDIHNLTQINIVSQLHIIESLSSRIEGVLADIEGSLISGVQDAELSTAASLKKISLRAAGAMAGVILEDHLQRVAHNCAVTISKKNPTISDLNDPLKQAGVYDQATWRKIQYLGDVRNLCSHKKDQEPTSEQIDELINGVNWVIKNIV